MICAYVMDVVCLYFIRRQFLEEKYFCSAVDKHQQHNFKIKWKLLFVSGWVEMTIMLDQSVIIINAWEKH